MSAENPLEDVKEGLVVKPGDMLILTFDRKIRDDEIFDMIDWLKKILPGVRVALLPGVDKMALIPQEAVDEVR